MLQVISTLHLSDWLVLCAGLVNGVQSSLQNLFQSLSFVAGLMYWRPQQFARLMYNSVAVVVLAAAVYTAFSCCGPRIRPMTVGQL